MDLPSSIGVQIRVIQNMISRRAGNSPTSRQLERMTCTNAWLIGYIAEQTDQGREVFQKDIEETFGVTRSSVSRVIKLMEQKGLVRRESVAQDARLKKLVLTEQARDMVCLLREDARQLEAEITRGFSAQEIDALNNFLARIQKNLS